MIEHTYGSDCALMRGLPLRLRRRLRAHAEEHACGDTEDERLIARRAMRDMRALTDLSVTQWEYLCQAAIRLAGGEHE